MRKNVKRKKKKNAEQNRQALISHGLQYSDNTIITSKKTINMKKYLILSIALFFCMIATSCSNSSKSKVAQRYEKTVPEKLKEAKSIQEVEQLIDGTTWHFTENLSISEIKGWCKVSFNNGQYTTYYAKPSDGKWTEGGHGRYVVSEGRYSNTGEKYIAVSWEGDMQVDWLPLPCEFTLTMDNFQLVIGSSLSDHLRRMQNRWDTSSPKMRGYMSYGDYNWD